jgi:hypothetical protein
MLINTYENLKYEKLLQYGANEMCICRTELMLVTDFTEFYGLALTRDFNIENYEFVLYYEQNGTVESIVGFSNMIEFEAASKSLGEYLKMDQWLI